MGTSRSGRYINTKGSGTSVSDFALIHSSEGKYTKPARKNDKLRLVSGGHGQAGLDQLGKYGIKYKFVLTYTNGVLVVVVKTIVKIGNLFPVNIQQTRTHKQ